VCCSPAMPSPVLHVLATVTPASHIHDATVSATLFRLYCLDNSMVVSLYQLCCCPSCPGAGIPIDQVARLSQSERDAVGRKIFQITLLELFRFRFMQVRTQSPVGCTSAGRDDDEPPNH